MARASKGNGAHRNDAAPPSGDASASGGATPWDSQAGIESGMRLTREAIAASLDQAHELCKLALAMQQTQLRALASAASDLDQARTALAEADDPAALAAVPGRLLGAQWLHSLENASSMAEQLMQVETGWVQHAQAQTAERFAALSALMPSVPSWNNGPAAEATSRASVGNGADQAQQNWQQWFDSWQGNVEQMSRAWSDALRKVRGSQTTS